MSEPFDPSSFIKDSTSDPAIAASLANLSTLELADLAAKLKTVEDLPEEARKEVRLAIMSRYSSRRTAQRRVTRREDQPYYTEDRWNKIRILIDKIILDGKDRFLSIADYPNVSLNTLYNIVCQSIRWGTDNDTSGKYQIWKRNTQIMKEESRGGIRFKAQKLDFDFVDTPIDENEASFKEIKLIITGFIENARMGSKLMLPGDKRIDPQYYCAPFVLKDAEVNALQEYCNGFAHFLRSVVNNDSIICLKFVPGSEKLPIVKEEDKE